MADREGRMIDASPADGMDAALGHLAFFGLTSNPFPVTPVPELFITATIQQIIDECLHGVLARKGFMVICGEIGLGKTTISRKILDSLHVHEVRTALILHPFPDPLELLRAIARDFGIFCPDNSHLAGQIDCLNNFLLEQNAQGGNCAILIDDAQNLSPECLEIIRMISNLETGNRKLVQILLIGQPELNTKLCRHDMRQLRSRIVIFQHVQALKQDELGEYIESRFASAGGGTLRLGRGAISGIHARTRGNFRRINLLMDRVLYAAFAEETSVITRHLVRRAAADLSFQDENLDIEPPRFLKRLPAMATMALSSAMVAFFLLGGAHWLVRSLGDYRFPENFLTRQSEKDVYEYFDAAITQSKNFSGGLYKVELHEKAETVAELQQPSAPSPEPSPASQVAEEPSLVHKKMGAEPVVSEKIPQTQSLSVVSSSLPLQEKETMVSPDVRSFLAAYHLEGFAQEFQLALGKAKLPELAIRIYQETGLQLVRFPGKLPLWAQVFDILGIGGIGGNDPVTYYLFWMPPYHFEKFQKGDTGQNIKQVRARLTGARFLDASDDEVADQRLTSALLAFQREQGLPETGVPDAATVFMLEHLPSSAADLTPPESLSVSKETVISAAPEDTTVAEIH